MRALGLVLLQALFVTGTYAALTSMRLAGRMLAAALVTLVGACSSSVVDLRSPDGLGTDYVQGAVYVLLHDRYLDVP